MSYLDVPRIHFGGRFFTDPSTVDNDPTHYDPNVTNPSPWQEPDGQHRFQLVDCVVNSVAGPSGLVSDDPLIGIAVNSNPVPDYARMVDLDVYQQNIPTIYGMKLSIQLTENLAISGSIDPASGNGIWFNAVLPTRSWGSDYAEDSFGGDMEACAFYQSVIRIDPATWPSSTSSPVLDQLRAASTTVNGQILLSLKFVVDGFRNVPQDVNFRTGRIVGTVGPAKANEPLYNSGARYLQPRAFSPKDPWFQPSFNQAIFKVDTARKKLVLDLTNSICRQTAAGDPVDIGTLTATVVFLDPPYVQLGAVDYSGFTYNNNAAITEIDLTDAQLNALQNGKLQLVSSRTDLGDPIVLSEPTTAVSYAAEVRGIRMEGDPGTTATTQVYISKNGVPLAGKTLGLHIASVHGTTPGATVPPTNPGDTPQADGAISASITPSDATGFATVTITVLKDPGQRTPELDGQLYFINLYDTDQPVPNWDKDQPVQEHQISVVAFSQYAVNTNPSWEIVRNMMAPYMKIYPGMRKMIDLTDEHSFFIFANNPPWIAYNPKNPPPPYDPNGLNIDRGAIPHYLTQDFNSSLYMPISRDLSKNKLLTVLHYIKNLQTSNPINQQ